MARRTDAPRPFEYLPNVYARTSDTWGSRTGRRNTEFGAFPNLLGLNTAFDDLHKSDGESPYLRNVTYMGTKQKEQRAQVTSRPGAYRLASIGDETHFPSKDDAEIEMELHEGKAVEFEVNYTDVLVGGCLFVKNPSGNQGVLRVLLKSDRDHRPICDAAIDLRQISAKDFNQRNFYFIETINDKQVGDNPFATGGKCVIRLEIVDDINPNQDRIGASRTNANPIYVLATGKGRHWEANYTLPSINKCMKEIPYTWTDKPSIPLFGTITNANLPLKNGVEVCIKGTEYLVTPIKAKGTTTELWYLNLDTLKSAKIDAEVANVDVVRFADPIQGYLYYVDGVSPLRRIKLDGSWKGEDAIPKAENIDAGTSPEALTAKKGAKYIKLYGNILYLAHFPQDYDEDGKPTGGPNYVQFSLVNSKGAQPDQFNAGFYSPNESPWDSTCAPITGLNILGGMLRVWRSNGNSTFSPSALESLGTSSRNSPAQIDTYDWNLGIAEQEDCAEANDNLYIWNMSEGMRRISGTDSSFQSYKISDQFAHLTTESERYMIAHGNVIRFYFDQAGHGLADHCARYHQILASQSPWYMDDHTPIKWVLSDQNSDTLYAMHAQYPAFYIVDYITPDHTQYTDFDSSIEMEYHTTYKSPGGMDNETILRNATAKIIANSTTSWYIGIDVNREDNPSVWRVDVIAQEDPEPNPDAMFSQVASPGVKDVNIMMNKMCNSAQFRFKCICNRSFAELVYAGFQYGAKPSL